MTIKEALGRKQRGTPSHLEALDQKRKQEQEYAKALLNKGVEVLANAGVPEMLEELREHVVVLYPDAKTAKVDPVTSVQVPNIEGRFLLNNGRVEMSLGWNYSRSYSSRVDVSRYEKITVAAYPLTGDIAVEGIGVDFIPAVTVQKPEGKTVLEDAIINAFRNPPIFTPSVSKS